MEPINAVVIATIVVVLIICGGITFVVLRDRDDDHKCGIGK